MVPRSISGVFWGIVASAPVLFQLGLQSGSCAFVGCAFLVYVFPFALPASCLFSWIRTRGWAGPIVWVLGLWPGALAAVLIWDPVFLVYSATGAGIAYGTGTVPRVIDCLQ